MNVRIHTPRRQNHPFPRNHLRTRPNHDRYAILNVRIPRLANPADIAILHPHIRLNNAPPI